MQDLGKDLGYVGYCCPNCGRVRVIAYSGGRHICEKCNWCIEDNAYFNWDKYFEEHMPSSNIDFYRYYKRGE